MHIPVYCVIYRVNAERFSRVNTETYYDHVEADNKFQLKLRAAKAVAEKQDWTVERYDGEEYHFSNGGFIKLETL